MKKSGTQKIQSLRQQVADLQVANNDIVERIWRIDELMTASDASNEALLQEKEQLMQQLADKDFERKINSLKHEIYELEIKEYGQSSVLDHSPNESNIFS